MNSCVEKYTTTGDFHGCPRQLIEHYEPLNVQNAVDLDEMDVDISATASSTSNKHNIIMGSETSKSISRPRVASATVEGDVTVMPLSSTPIDMSVIPEPVPKVDGVEPSWLPSYGGLESISIRIIGQHFGTEAELDQVVSINGRACKETKWISVTNLECIGPPSFADGTKALVQVNVARSTSDQDSDKVTVEYISKTQARNKLEDYLVGVNESISEEKLKSTYENLTFKTVEETITDGIEWLNVTNDDTTIEDFETKMKEVEEVVKHHPQVQELSKTKAQARAKERADTAMGAFAEGQAATDQAATDQAATDQAAKEKAAKEKAAKEKAATDQAAADQAAAQARAKRIAKAKLWWDNNSHYKTIIKKKTGFCRDYKWKDNESKYVPEGEGSCPDKYYESCHINKGCFCSRSPDDCKKEKYKELYQHFRNTKSSELGTNYMLLYALILVGLYFLYKRNYTTNQ